MVNPNPLSELLGQARDPAAEDAGRFKRWLKARGVNQRGWRLLLDFGEVLFSPLASWLTRIPDPQVRLDEHLAWLRLLQGCEMDLIPPKELVRALCQALELYSLAELDSAFLRAAWKEMARLEYLGSDPWDFLYGELPLITRWLVEQGGREQLRPGQLKSGWKAIRKAFRGALSDRGLAARVCWEVEVFRVEYAGIRFQALNSALSLLEEGWRMEHCIADYLFACASGRLQAWHACEARSAWPLATFTVSMDARGRWWLEEIHGPGNGEVDERIVQAADAVCRSLEDAGTPSMDDEADEECLEARLERLW